MNAQVVFIHVLIYSSTFLRIDTDMSCVIHTTSKWHTKKKYFYILFLSARKVFQIHFSNRSTICISFQCLLNKCNNRYSIFFSFIPRVHPLWTFRIYASFGDNDIKKIIIFCLRRTTCQNNRCVLKIYHRKQTACNYIRSA